MSSKLSVTFDLLDLMLANEKLSSMVNGQIFPLVAPEDTTGDFIIYARTDGGTQMNMMCASDEWCELTYNVVTSKYMRGIEIAETLRAALQDITIDKEPMILTKTKEDYVGEGNLIKYVQILVFSVGKTE